VSRERNMGGSMRNLWVGLGCCPGLFAVDGAKVGPSAARVCVCKRAGAKSRTHLSPVRVRLIPPIGDRPRRQTRRFQRGSRPVPLPREWRCPPAPGKRRVPCQPRTPRVLGCGVPVNRPHGSQGRRHARDLAAATRRQVTSRPHVSENSCGDRDILAGLGRLVW
jgi:hypothetical protein